MQLEFRLRRVLIRQPLPRQILRPIVTTTLITDNATWATEALLDTGSDHSAFSEALAVQLGVDLSRAPRGRVETASGSLADAAFVPLTLRLTDDAGNCLQWDSQVAFVRTSRRISLFGYTACREYFDTSISETDERLTMATTFRFPGAILRGKP